MDHEHNPPAISRPFGEADRSVEVLSTPRDTVSFTRGWGDSGRRVEVVEHDCPACQFDRMVRRHRVSAEMRDSADYWCLNPNCGHFVSDQMSHNCFGNYPQRSIEVPAEVGWGEE